MLKDSVAKLTKIGPSYDYRLKKLNISTIEDLLYHFPARYENWGEKNKLNTVKVGEKVSVEGTVWQIRNVRTRYGKFLTFATINDGTGSIECVWFNQQYLTRVVKVGQKLGLAGKADYFNNALTLINPEHELNQEGNSLIHTAGLVAVYPETRGVSSKWLRTKIKSVLDGRESEKYEILPSEILKKHNLMGWFEAISSIHFPKDEDLAAKARKRFAFEELFMIQLSAQKRKRLWEKFQTTDSFSVDQEKVLGFIANLPFDLTTAQNKALKEIIHDLKQDKPMNRLLQGDVGSGKTVVAAIVSYISFLNGKNVLLMAPTEILANQHFQTLDSLLKPHGIKIGLQTAAKKSKNPVNLAVGTHALIHSKNLPKNLGLIIVDEQHRFGVEQRALLRGKGSVSHFLTMSATPIPRTLALTLYGDLDLSVIDELPKGRQKIKTFVVPKEKRNSAYDFIRKHVQKGKQVFIICPLIDPSETLNSVKSAKEEWGRLSREVFPELSVDLLHGRMKSKEKDLVIKKFKSADTNILVSTPVVEVGIDVPNATIMMIEAAERFGLAQLHQIRGRVGRGTDQSFCLLFTESRSREIISRLKYMEQKHIGLELAELDLKLRGPGQLYGTAQHGVPFLKIASLSDTALIEETRKEASKILQADLNLRQYTTLQEKLQEKYISPD